jgi:hypothetical protein
MLIDAPKELELKPSERCFYVVKELLALTSEIDDIHAALNDTITLCDQKTQDVLHEMEFNPFSASEGYAFAKQLQAIRKERRDAKNQKEYIVHFKKFADDHKNLPVVLSRMLHSMKQVRQTQEARTYTPKVQGEGESA